MVFSKTSQPIWFNLLKKEDIVTLHMYAKLQVQAFFVPVIEGQMVVKMGPKLDFRSFLKNYSTDLVPSPSEGRYHYSTYSCQFLSPEQFLFSRYSSQRQFSTSRNVEISLKFCCVSVCIFVVYLFVCVVCRSFSQFLTMS